MIALAPVLLLTLGLSLSGASSSSREPSGLEPDSPRLQRLVHGAAADLPWHFDLEEAGERAHELGQPLLVYVRCLDGYESFAHAQRSIALPELGLADDGYAKDVLFRAGVLSDARVAALIERRFRLACSTYVLADVDVSTQDEAGQPTTPALLVIAPDGSELGRLDRVGVLSADRIDAWLREFVSDAESPLDGRDAQELFLDGELELLLRATRFDVSGSGRLWRSRALARLGRLEEAKSALEGLGGVVVYAQRARLATRSGEWREASRWWAEARRTARGTLQDEATFGLAWAKSRLGEAGLARALWYTMISESALGRRAAACLLRDGPRLGLALSSRAYSAEAEDLPGSVQSLRALIELQEPNGAFTATLGFNGNAWCDPAITAIALEALRAWQAEAPVELQGAVLESADLALAFLLEWSLDERAPRGAQAFNEPYVLRALLAEGAHGAAQRVVQRMQRLQLPAGGWSAYGDGWSVSFLTASGVLAWLDARAAGLDVPEPDLDAALDALEFLRGPEGSFPYSYGPGRAWMTTAHGSIARDPLCELALLRGGRGSFEKLERALSRFCKHAPELAAPTKRLDDAYDERGHGSYHFFYGHANAVEASWFAGEDTRKRVARVAHEEIGAQREADGTFLDHWMLGRAYATAMALRVAAAARD